MHERRYARHGGWRRYQNCPGSRFGFGGPGYGGFGRYGMYGGYRSHYNYACNYNPIYANNTAQTVNSRKFAQGFKMTLKWILILTMITLTFIAFE